MGKLSDISTGAAKTAGWPSSTVRTASAMVSHDALKTVFPGFGEGSPSAGKWL
jgi:hypothetical protein